MNFYSRPYVCLTIDTAENFLFTDYYVVVPLLQQNLSTEIKLLKDIMYAHVNFTLSRVS